MGVNTWGLRIMGGTSPSSASSPSFFGFSSAVSELGAWLGPVVGGSMPSREGAEFGVGTVDEVIFGGLGVGFGCLTLGVVFGFLVEVSIWGASVGFGTSVVVTLELVAVSFAVAVVTLDVSTVSSVVFFVVVVTLGATVVSL